MRSRLKVVAKYIKGFNKLADIACDHAQLSIYAIKENLVKTVIASDIHQGPLSSGIENIKKYNLEDKITVKKADGLDSIDENVDVIVIAGLGGSVIKGILEQGKDKLKNVKRIVLQPNVGSNNCREFLNKNNYKIIDETVIEDSNILYEIIVAEQGTEILSEDEMKFGPILLKERKELFIELLKNQKENYEKTIKKIPKDKIPNELLDSIEKLKQLIKGE